ncbi:MULTISPECIES: helix-hairpin-helix domain-containing protein [Sulfurimonas]|uniref:Helix-hairpin-helix domain-containing protein n=1 Tax=Sulfurimonas diazotrophicus TaxID=3131939 RepID=A0ABZ3H8E9_9BACT
MGFVKKTAAVLAALVISIPLFAGVNLNTATAEELSSLKGIGPATAAKIIEYRKEHRFNSIEDIMNVKGVGEKTFLKLKDELEV